MDALTALRASGIRMIIFEDDAITTICDGCGCEIALAAANYAGPELPLWEGATLCSECYAAEIANTQRPNAVTLRELQKSIAWYD